MRNPGALHVNWGPVNDEIAEGTGNPKLGISDIDGVFDGVCPVVMECKNDGEKLSKSTLITLRRFAEYPGVCSLVVKMNSMTGEVYGYKRVMPPGAGPSVYTAADTQEFARLLLRWRAGE